jgi:archaellum component FlaC
MNLVEMVLSLVLASGFGYISKKLDKLEAQIEAIEDDFNKLVLNIERRAKFVRRSDEKDEE